MNLFSEYQKKIIDYLQILKKSKTIDLPQELKNLIVEMPPKNHKGDMSCNAAMILSKHNKKQPIEIAEILKKYFLQHFNEFESIEIAKPGFLNINFKINFWKNYLIKIVQSNNSYGSNKNLKKKYNIEFVSANPTGPLHVGHCRGAILGDVLSNLLVFNGNIVTKEYYVNDQGKQIKNYVLSVYYRILEITKKKVFPTDENLYPGNYVIDIANKIIDKANIKDFESFDRIYEKLKEESLKISMDLIKKTLNNLGIMHDKFVYETELIKNDFVSKTIKKLRENDYIYEGKLNPPKGNLDKNWESRNQILFRSTNFGDDVDRALQKIDGTWTYFAADIAYHAYKINRNFDVLINILGADHTGYINRIESAVKALSKNKINFICKVSQLVKLFKNGQPFKMSKRKGDYITVEDLIQEVGRDSVRFMMLSRSNDVELDFDFKKVTEHSKDNPVFYVQYAYARINSIFRNAKLKIDSKIRLPNDNFNINKYEIEILKKISSWPKCVELSISKLEPHRITYFLYELSTLFHSYWNLGKENKDYRFLLENKNLNKPRLLILQALAIVINNGLSILGVSAPKRM